VCAANPTREPTPPPPQRDGALPRAAALGRYIVLGLVGTGGMGEVYAAFDPELDRKVALKLLRVRGGDGDGDGRLRLMREAQAIAKLSHPNVVTVYDVGTFQDHVFIAMQFVDGHTLGHWMHAQQREWPDVVRVFADAGRGLAAAHEKDLVHRDFKPENVMVSEDGHVRVMDFGLARVVDRTRRATEPLTTLPPTATPPEPPPAAPAPAAAIAQAVAPKADAFDPDSTQLLTHPPSSGSADGRLTLELTQEGAVLGTPAYMSPEQFRGVPADARTDQFSFCVALYEALYGERPFPGRNLLELTASVLGGGVREAPDGARVPAWVRGILQRGLRVNPDDRWPSMTALLAALETDRRARPHRRFAADAAEKLRDVWEVPARARATSSMVKDQIRHAFLETGESYAAVAFDKVSAILDGYARGWSAMYADACEATHVRGEQSAEVLDLRMAALHEALDGLKALSRVLRQANSDVVQNAVGAAGALAPIDRCADVKLLRSVVKPPDDPVLRDEVDRVRGEMADARVLFQVGRLREALDRLEPLVRDARRIGYAPLLAEVLLDTGSVYAEQRDATVAVPTLEEAVWAAELSRHDEVRAKAMVTLIYITGALQLRFDVGEIWARYAETLLARIGGHEYLVGWLYTNRSGMRQRQSRLHEAVEDARRAVAVNERLQGPDGADVGLSLGNLGIFLEELGDLDAAASYNERAVRTIEAALGPDHPRTGVLLSNCAEVLNRVGRFSDAREMSRRALAIFERAAGSDAMLLTYPLTALGIAHLGGAEPELAVPLLERSVAIRDAGVDKPSSRAEARFALARALDAAGGDQARARGLARQARDEYARDVPHPATERQLAAIDAWLAARDQ
jgi:serine/threonine protein kinase